VISILAMSVGAVVATYYASYTRSFTWTVANTTFELEVNGTLQAAQVNPTINLGALSSADSYCEVYNLTNTGDVPINITATVTLPPGSAVATFLTSSSMSDMATIGAGASVDMVLLINDFQQAGTATVTFNSVKAFIEDPTLVTTITQTITNDEDSGFAGYWALDNYVKTVQVWNLGGNNFVALADYVGTFTTYTDDLSPQVGATEGGTGTGAYLGSYVGTFTYTGTNPASVITLPSASFGGTTADLAKDTYGNGQVGDTSAVSWFSTYFSGASTLTLTQWGWTYLYSANAGDYNGQMWNNYVSGSNGDIVIP
jgi:hypothetical protein